MLVKLPAAIFKINNFSVRAGDVTENHFTEIPGSDISKSHCRQVPGGDISNKNTCNSPQPGTFPPRCADWFSLLVEALVRLQFFFQVLVFLHRFFLK